MSIVFISYSRNDSAFAARLRNDLIQNNIPTWRDQEDILPGVNWDNAIQEVLSSGQISHFLVALSQAAADSENVKDEISLALDRRIEYIIPLQIEDCNVPLRILRRNRLDFRKEYDQPFRQLLELLRMEASLPVVEVVEELPQPDRNPTKEQREAAQDEAKTVRLIAGPGTGKSFVIEERVRWLLSTGVSAKTVFVVSFTRAASRDLRSRIIEYCKKSGQKDVDEVSVTTLHSMALRALRKAKLLYEYPVDPQVLDKWELENVFDKEFSDKANLRSTICEEIRLAFEAFWSTGQWNPPNYIQPENPITEDDKAAFQSFHVPTSQTYSCVLPGEIIKKCVEYIEDGQLDPVRLLEISQLIVDEYQDLNNTDLAFIDTIIQSGVTTYIAGDDDQSIYSFRYAFPKGIQEFTNADRYPDTKKYELPLCFRCTPEILLTAQKLIQAYPGINRIPKSLISQYENLQPLVQGIVQRWCFASSIAEAKAVAQSCKLLVDKGIEAREILILISNRRALLRLLQDAFDKIEDLDIELPSGARYVDQAAGRFAYAIVRIACDDNLEDYVAHRLVLGLLKGIGTKTCNNIKKNVIENNLNYIDIFYKDIPGGVFSGRETGAINRARSVFEIVIGWKSEDSIGQHSGKIANLIADAFDKDSAQAWIDYLTPLPSDMNLEELLAFMATDNDEQQASILESVYQRLKIEVPEEGLLPSRVRIMTMHGAKGLNAQVVFIPGLEEDILPGQKRRRYPGLVFEAARLLYVSITRARAACILSYAASRIVFGEYTRGNPSRFNTSLNGQFVKRSQGLSNSEADDIVSTVTSILDIIQSQ